MVGSVVGAAGAVGLTRVRLAPVTADSTGSSSVPGIASRKIAAEALLAVLHRKRPLDEVLDPATGIRKLAALDERDRAFVRMLAATVLRRFGTLRRVIHLALDRGLPERAPKTEIALLLGTAQLFFLGVPDHAAVDSSVTLASEEHNGRYAGLVNAVLRRLAREGRERTDLDPALDTPEWLRTRWRTTYGEQTAAKIMAANATEAPLDLTVKSEAKSWASRLDARVLPTGTVRRRPGGLVSQLPGYEEGEWWVQDAAAALPVRLLGNVTGLKVADLCAAPGGKTAQLAAAGAHVVAVDRSAARLQRLAANLERLRLSAEPVQADATEWSGGPFDAVLLDAPCSGTGTIRRHPDVPWQKRPDDIVALARVQARLLDRAADLTRPGGLLVYATCSLEPEESELQVESFLARRPDFGRVPIDLSEVGRIGEFISAKGELRTLPFHLPDPEPELAGCDGFFAARLRRAA